MTSTLGKFPDSFLFSVPRCARDDLHRLRISHDLPQEVTGSLLVHCCYTIFLWELQHRTHLVGQLAKAPSNYFVYQTSVSLIEYGRGGYRSAPKIIFIFRYGLSAVSLNMLLSAVAIEVFISNKIMLPLPLPLPLPLQVFTLVYGFFHLHHTEGGFVIKIIIWKLKMISKIEMSDKKDADAPNIGGLSLE